MMHLLLIAANRAMYHEGLEHEWPWTNAITSRRGYANASDFDTRQIPHAVVALLEAIT
jgi:hypothetical protein